MKVKFGSLVVAGSGKLGGHVYAKNRGGAYARTKTTPINPQTLAQANVRNGFTANSQAWRGLTDDQRAAWSASTGNFPAKDRLGDSITLTGANLYQRINQNLYLVGIASLSEPPLPTSVTPLTSLTLTAAAGTPAMSLVFAPTPVPTGYKLIVEATAQQSAGRSFVKNKYRRIATVAAAATSPYDLLADYNAKFGSLTAGTKVFVRCKFIDTATGFESQYIATDCIVAA